MRGLRKYLTPFAPDSSGAVSVLYELGGLTVVCDAGGCTGNICGFDEPRWQKQRSAIFSAGLRDMDAILGRDDKLVGELADAAEKLDAAFAAIVGTPVPSVIGTDYLALRRMAEKRVGIPVLTVDTTGMELYDRGAEKAYLALFDRFAAEACPVRPGRIGVIGANPLDMSDVSYADKLKEVLPGAVCYGMGSTLEDVKLASAAEKNLVCAPSGIPAAMLLKKRFGTPFEVLDPLAAGYVPGFSPAGKRILIVDQQISANSLRDSLLARSAASVECATWFALRREYARKGDIQLREEDDFAELVTRGGFDAIVCDPALFPIVPAFSGELVTLPQFPVSGLLRGGKTL